MITLAKVMVSTKILVIYGKKVPQGAISVTDAIITSGTDGIHDMNLTLHDGLEEAKACSQVGGNG